MKLKKIASLMLAGIMAVSMLAACGEGKKDENAGSSSSAPVANDFTSAVLSEASDYIQNKVKAVTNEDLETAVRFVCDNGLIGSYSSALTPATSSDFIGVYNDALKAMPSDYTVSGNVLTKDYSTIKKDNTYWTFFVVGGKRDDDYIAKEMGKMMSQMKLLTDEECAYNISIVKGECDNNNGVASSQYATSTVIGVVFEVDYLK